MALNEEAFGISALLMTAAACFHARFWAMPLRVALSMVSNATAAVAARKRDSSLAAPSLPAAPGQPPSPDWQGPQVAIPGSAGRQC